MKEIDPRLNWVVSYPKSGNTWIRLVASAYATGKPTIHGQAKLGDVGRMVWHDVSPMPVQDLPVAVEPQLRPAAMLNLAMMKEGRTVPVKSHHGNYTIGGSRLWQDAWADSIVNPIRDPREVCCSVKHHFGHDTYDESVEFMASAETKISDDGHLHHFIGSWSMHVRSWLESDLDVLNVRYEDLWTDVYENEDTEVFTAIFEHLGVDVDAGRLGEAVDKCRFERLQEQEDEDGFPETSDQQERFFRRGETDGWEDELPEGVARQIEEDHGDVMQQLGYL